MNLNFRTRIILIGLFTSFFSGLGQTFLISLFVPFFQKELSLSALDFGSIYSGATLAGAFVLPYLGAKLDSTPLRIYSLFVGLGIFISYLLMGWATTLPIFFIALVLQRLCGQGLLSHISTTIVARYIAEKRGRALSISSLGFPLAEAAMPPLVVLLMVYIGERPTLFFLGSLMLFVYSPLLFGLTSLPEVQKGERSKESHGELMVTGKTRRQLIRDPFFYKILPLHLAPPFFLTALFFYQADLAESKGWTLLHMAQAFPAFALSRTLFTFLGGPLVDRRSGVKVIPFALIPLMLGVLLLIVFSGSWVPAAYLFLAGLGVGIGSTSKAAMWAEVYGTRHLGAIRSLVTTLAVVATALSPALFGWLIDSGVPWSLMLKVSLFTMVLATVLAHRAVHSR